VSFSDPSTLLRLASLIGFLVIAVQGARSGIFGRFHRIALAGPVVASLLAHFAPLRPLPPDGSLRLVSPHVHFPDVYHYYVGAKYFRELGYHGLYEATVVADYEDDRSGFRDDRLIRDLRTNRLEVRRGSVLLRQSQIKAAFSPGRWREFRDDIRVFRSASPDHWRTSKIQYDHGYNGTPATTAVLGLLANWAPVETTTFVETLRWVDVCLVLLVGALVARLRNTDLALAFLFFWFVNPLNDRNFIGGSYLRYNYLLALCLAVIFFGRGRPVLSGICFSVSTVFRIFPILFLLGLVAHDVLGRERRARLRAHRSLYLSFALASVLLVGTTALVEAPGGVPGWLAFYERIAEHAGNQAPNRIGWKSAFLYSHRHNVKRVAQIAPWRGDLDWIEATGRTFHERRVWYAASSALLLTLGALYLRRVDARQAVFVGLFAVFVLLFLANYYYAMLAVVPLIFANDRRVWVLLALLMIAVTLVRPVNLLREITDLQFLIVSVEILVFLLLAMALTGTRPRERARIAHGVRIPGESRISRSA
jgi:hypothetical protein